MIVDQTQEPHLLHEDLQELSTQQQKLPQQRSQQQLPEQRQSKQQEACPAPKKRKTASVRFFHSVRVKAHLSREDLTEAERQSYYYQKHELAVMQRHAVACVQRFLSDSVTNNDNNNNNNNTQIPRRRLCVRGLEVVVEKLRLNPTRLNFYPDGKRVVQEVLRVQATSGCQFAMANKSAESSRNSVQAAASRAAKDASDALKLMQLM